MYLLCLLTDLLESTNKNNQESVRVFIQPNVLLKSNETPAAAATVGKNTPITKRKKKRNIYIPPGSTILLERGRSTGSKAVTPA